jgi:DNA repair protein RadC
MYQTQLPAIRWAREESQKYQYKNSSLLSNTALLATLLGCGDANAADIMLAKNLLYYLDQDIEKLADLSLAELTQIKGIDMPKAKIIRAAVELCFTRMRKITNKPFTNYNSIEAYELIHPLLDTSSADSFWLFLLDENGKFHHHQKTENDQTNFGDPRTILQIALKKKCFNIILVHQSKALRSSESLKNRTYTQQLIQSANALSIIVQDHIIIHPEGYYSYRDNDLIS